MDGIIGRISFFFVPNDAQLLLSIRGLMRWLYQKHHFFLLQIWNFFFWAGFHSESHLDTHCLVKDPLILENWRFAHMICRFGLHDLHFWHWHLTERNKNGNVNIFFEKIFIVCWENFRQNCKIFYKICTELKNIL